jgi:hypothetical protein
VGKEIVRMSMACPKIEKNEREPEMTKGAVLLAYFRNAARNDLKIHPPQYTREEWRQLGETEKSWWQFWR